MRMCPMPFWKMQSRSIRRLRKRCRVQYLVCTEQDQMAVNARPQWPRKRLHRNAKKGLDSISNQVLVRAGGGGRDRTGVHGFAGRCITTLLPRHGCVL